MIGTELINKIKELGEDKEIIIEAEGACEGMMCYMVRKNYQVSLSDNTIYLRIDVDDCLMD